MKDERREEGCSYPKCTDGLVPNCMTLCSVAIVLIFGIAVGYTVIPLVLRWDNDAPTSDVTPRESSRAHQTREAPFSVRRSLDVTPDFTTPHSSTVFSCHDRPYVCGFVYIHFCLNQTKCSQLNASRVEEALVSTVVSATRLRPLIHESSPIVLLTNYPESVLRSWMRVLRNHIGQRSGSLESSDTECSATIEFGGGEEKNTNAEPRSSPSLSADDERRASGIHELRDQLLGNSLDERWGPFTHVVSFSGDSTESTPFIVQQPLSIHFQDAFIKPDVLHQLIAADGDSLTTNGSAWKTLRSKVQRWLYLDGDTLPQNRTPRDWQFKDDHPSVLSDNTQRRVVRGTKAHMESDLLVNITWLQGAPSTFHSPRSTAPMSLYYSALDALQWNDLALVPELNSQRDAGPHLYTDLIQDLKFPDVKKPVFSFGYRYAMLYERQFNTGLIAFQGTSFVRTVLTRWSQIHRDVERCRFDRVAWDQCSLPRALRSSHPTSDNSTLRRHARVASLWEPLNARDALGRGCSTILYANTVHNFRMNREHAITLHRHGAKRFMKCLLVELLGFEFLSVHTIPW